MIKKILIAPMFYFESTSSSKLINKLSGDLKKIDNEIIPKFRIIVSAITILLTFIYNILFAYLEKQDYRCRRNTDNNNNDCILLLILYDCLKTNPQT